MPHNNPSALAVVACQYPSPCSLPAQTGSVFLLQSLLWGSRGGRPGDTASAVPPCQLLALPMCCLLSTGYRVTANTAVPGGAEMRANRGCPGPAGTGHGEWCLGVSRAQPKLRAPQGPDSPSPLSVVWDSLPRGSGCHSPAVSPCPPNCFHTVQIQTVPCEPGGPNSPEQRAWWFLRTQRQSPAGGWLMPSH